MVVDETVRDIILSRLDKIDEKLDRIEKQTTMTNGRVSYLEKRSDAVEYEQKGLRSRIESLEERQNINKALASKDTVLGDEYKYWVKVFISVAPWIVMGLYGIVLVLQRVNIL